MGIEIDWRVALHTDARDTLEKTINRRVQKWGHTSEVPSKVIVSRPTFDPRDERVVVEFLSETGDVLAGGQIAKPEEPNTSP